MYNTAVRLAAEYYVSEGSAASIIKEGLT